MMNASQDNEKIHGYDRGTDKVAKSPITMEEWEELKKSALFSEEDVVYLRLSEDVLVDQVDDLLETCVVVPVAGTDSPMKSPLWASAIDIFSSAWPLCSMSLNSGMSGTPKPIIGTVKDGAPRNDCP